MFNRNDFKKSDIEHHVQRGLFDPPIDLVQDPGPALKAAMRAAEKEVQQKYHVSRPNIIDSMNAMADVIGLTCNGKSRKVTSPIYNKWLSASERHHIPLRWLHIFCRAVRSNGPLEVYATFFDQARLVSDEDIKKLRWAELEIQKRKLTKQAKQLATEVGL